MDRRFEHLFPSPDLSDSRSTQLTTKFTIANSQIQNNLRNIRQDRIRQEADQYRRMMSSGKYILQTTLSSLTKIRQSRSLSKNKLSENKIQPNHMLSQNATNKDLYKKSILRKNSDEVPSLFIEGKLEIVSFSQNKTALLQIKKLVNISKKPIKCSFKVILMGKRLNHNAPMLEPKDYQVVLAGYLPQVLAQSHFYNLEITGKWQQPRNQKNRDRLYVVLIDESTSCIVCIGRCRSVIMNVQKKYDMIAQMLC